MDTKPKIKLSAIETIEKLRSFYDIFSAKWAKVLANRKVTDTEDL